MKEFGDQKEACVQVYKVGSDSYAMCHMGYLQHCLLIRIQDQGWGFDGTWLHVQCDLCLSKFQAEHKHLHRNKGIVLHQEIRNNPCYTCINP